MPRPAKQKPDNNGANLGLEAELWLVRHAHGATGGSDRIFINSRLEITYNTGQERLVSHRKQDGLANSSINRELEVLSAAIKNGNRVRDARKGLLAACGKVGIEDFRFHDLRYTCAAWFVTAGVPLNEVRDLLGHSSVTMTGRYAHLAPDRVRSAASILDASRLRHAEPEKVKSASIS